MKLLINNLFIILISFSCVEKKKLKPNEYISYMNSNENSFTRERKFNNIKYKLKIQPAEILALHENDLSAEKIQKSINYYKDKLNFILIIEDDGSYKVRSTVFEKEKYGTVLSYANTDLKKDFTLINGKDSVYCSLLHLESANSIQPVIRMTIGFTGIQKLESDLTLIYNDNIFSNGPLKFYYSKEALNDLPQLNF